MRAMKDVPDTESRPSSKKRFVPRSLSAAARLRPDDDEEPATSQKQFRSAEHPFHDIYPLLMSTRFRPK
jgi:hypothetical protein